MRKRTLRSGMRVMVAAIVCVIVATFFSSQVSRWLFMGMADEGRLSFLLFFMGWVCAGWGTLVAVAGFVQSGAGNEQVKIASTFILLISLIVLFFVLAYNSMITPSVPPLKPGDTINI